MAEIALKQARCTSLHVTAPVQLRNEPDAVTSNSFLIQAYTGSVVDRWWGKLAIAVDGITARQQIPIFLNHDPDQIVGYSMSTRKDQSFWVEGVFSRATDEAKKAKGLASEGFPWQASIGVRAKKIMQLPDEKASYDVNGQTVFGPAEIWLESEVFETSFVPLGADDNTSIVTFSKFNEKAQEEAPLVGAEHNNNKKSEVVMEKVTLEVLEKDAPELLESIIKDAEKKGYVDGFNKGVAEGKEDGLKIGVVEGAKAERARIQDVLSQSLPGHDALIQKLAFDGQTSGPEAAVKVLAAEKLAMKTAKESLEDDAVQPVVEVAAPITKVSKEVTAETFSQHKDLVDEFGSYGIYEAYKTAMSQGIVKITGGK